MKLPLPKKISVRMVTTLILIAVILLEAYLAYFFLYTKLSPQPQVSETSNSIVRINRTALNDVITFLNGLENYQPAALTLTNPDPFKYSP